MSKTTENANLTDTTEPVKFLPKTDLSTKSRQKTHVPVPSSPRVSSMQSLYELKWVRPTPSSDMTFCR